MEHRLRLRASGIGISITPSSDELHPRGIVALLDQRPVEVQLLYPDLGISEPLAAVADRYRLDFEALAAAAQSAFAAPDRVISLEVAARSAA